MWLLRASANGIVGELSARLDIHHQRRAALHHGDLRAARGEILRDVVPAVAGADDQRALALPRLAVLILGRMQHRAGEILQ
jgi:hypothetical protein